MKLNLDCVRDILMDIEDMTDGYKSILISEENYKILPNCRKYNYTELRYHLLQCQQNGYFINGSLTFDEDFSIVDLSPKAHDFIAKIRDNNIWSKFKKMLIGLGTIALPALIDKLNSLLL